VNYHVVQYKKFPDRVVAAGMSMRR